jgi:hypothetical protein
VAASARGPARIPLEPVVTVVMPPAQQGPGGGGQIRKREQRPELLRLPHVNALMRSRSLEAIRITAEHNVPERHRVGAHGCHAQEQASKSPVTFEDAAVRPCPPAGQERQGHGQEPEERHRRGPEIAAHTACTSIRSSGGQGHRPRVRSAARAEASATARSGDRQSARSRGRTRPASRRAQWRERPGGRRW